MERNFYNDDFERLIRQKADQYKMYPSDQVWKGVYQSLHGRKRWRWAGLAVVLIGIGLYTGNSFIADKHATKVATNIQPSITATTQTSSSTAPLSSLNHDSHSNGVAISNKSRQLVGLPDGLLMTAANEASLNNPAPLVDLISPVTSLSSEGTVIFTNDPGNIAPVGNGHLPPFEKYSEVSDWAFATPDTKVSTIANNDGLKIADASSESVLKEMEKLGNINWLEEYAVFQLTAHKPKKIGLQLYFSPTVNYRKLSGSSNFHTSEVKNIPLSPTVIGDVDQYVKHRPALGFEVGANLVYRYTKRVNFKAGLQFNYSRYNIEAYEGHPEIATISLNNTPLLADNISSYSSIRNLSGFAREDLSNQYFQLSLPVGMELKVLGTKKLQLNVGGTIQPSYLLNRNSYLITTDFKNYMREPSLVRRLNVNAGVETFVSYSTGSIRWQVGPQFRYQLLSSYSRKYPIKEQLMEYGFKIGVSKTVR